MAVSDRFYAVPFNEDQIDISDTVRSGFAGLMDTLDDILPDSREKSLAVTNLQQAAFWANDCIARNMDN